MNKRPRISRALFAFLILGGTGNALQNAYLRTLILEAASDSVRGSVVSSYIATLQTAAIIGMGAAGFIDPHRARPTLVVAAAISIFVVVTVLPVVLQQTRSQPTTTVAQVGGAADDR